MSSRRELLQFVPVNIGADNLFSPDRNGLQQVVFQIPKLPRIMMGKTLRINGTFTVKDVDGNAPECGDKFFQEAPNATDVFYIDGRIGVSSCIDNLSIQNLQGATYSNVKNYNRLCSSLVPLNQSFMNYINGVDDEYAPGKQITQAKRCDKPFDFSIPLLDGFIQGQPVDMDLVEGLIITLTLAPSNFVIQGNGWLNPTAAAPLGSYYELSDIVLSVETELPDASTQEALQKNTTGSMTYRTYSSFYSVIVSNSQNLSYLFNTRDTTALIGNMVPSSWLNNYEYFSSSTPQLLYPGAGGTLNNNIRIDDFTYQRSGIRLPYDFEIVSRTSQEEGTADSVKNMIELNSVRDVWDLYNFTKSLKTELSNPLSDTKQNKFDRNRYSIVEEDLENQYNIGVAYDKFSNGIDFRNETFALRINSTLPSDVTFPPHSLFLFVEHENTVLFQNGQIQVLS
jgi:hypothetical protein